jgi:glycosyltransferase involved in cell wall biosynthesis
LDFESYDTTYLLQKDPKTILYVWRISYEKWFDRFAELVEKLNKKDRSYTFIICGKVRNDEKIAHHIPRLKTYDNVFFEW